MKSRETHIFRGFNGNADLTAAPGRNWKGQPASATRAAMRAPRRRTNELTMEHRVGQRWATDLAVQIAFDSDTQAQPGRLLNLSSNGGRLSFLNGRTSPGATAQVWLPLLSMPTPALVVYARDGMVGLLWSERSLRFERLLAAIRRHPEAARKGDLELLRKIDAQRSTLYKSAE